MPPEQGELSAYEFCCQSPAFLDASPGELAAAAKRLRFPLDWFYSDRLVKTFSGGEKVKLRMALLTLGRPDCYLLDEPLQRPDIDTLDWLETFIRECAQPVLFISHDELLLERTANVILHMEQLRRKTLPRWTVARMGYRQYVEERLQKFTHQEQLARKEREEERKQQERFQKIQQKVEHQLNTISRQDPHGSRLLKKKMKAVKSLEHRFEREREDMTEFPDSEEAILVGFGENTAITAGKTVLDFTLPALYAGGSSPGAAAPGGEPAAVRPGRGARVRHRPQRRGENHLPAAGGRGAAGAPGHPGGLHAPGLRRDRGPKPDAGGIFGQKLGEGGAHPGKDLPGQHEVHPEEQEHTIQELSGGQKAKLFFLKMILDGANVLVLDEPTRNFSPLSGPGDTGHFEGVPPGASSASATTGRISARCAIRCISWSPRAWSRGEPVALKPPFNAKKACGQNDRKPFA